MRGNRLSSLYRQKAGIICQERRKKAAVVTSHKGDIVPFDVRPKFPLLGFL